MHRSYQRIGLVQERDEDSRQILGCRNCPESVDGIAQTGNRDTKVTGMLQKCYEVQHDRQQYGYGRYYGLPHGSRHSR